ncbi:MAG: hypothetical protein A2Y70_08130 [Candidatus Aminicenantes bacterium RBG_13_64_14]|nr:MAG: hypothetical protein A2Y70_08130 [Candidatus Aminicenantes bacterium RBG_13_64_14]
MYALEPADHVTNIGSQHVPRRREARFVAVDKIPRRVVDLRTLGRARVADLAVRREFVLLDIYGGPEPGQEVLEDPGRIRRRPAHDGE